MTSFVFFLSALAAMGCSWEWQPILQSPLGTTSGWRLILLVLPFICCGSQRSGTAVQLSVVFKLFRLVESRYGGVELRDGNSGNGILFPY